jgi:hypothetical protein
VLRPDEHQAFRLRIRKRPQNHGIHDAEQQTVGPDPERQRHHRGSRISRTLAQRADRVLQVAGELLEPVPAPFIPAFLFEPGQVSELPMGCVPRLALAHPAIAVLLGLHFEVGSHFFFELAMELLRAKQDG